MKQDRMTCLHQQVRKNLVAVTAVVVVAMSVSACSQLSFSDDSSSAGTTDASGRSTSSTGVNERLIECGPMQVFGESLVLFVSNSTCEEAKSVVVAYEADEQTTGSWTCVIARQNEDHKLRCSTLGSQISSKYLQLQEPK